MFGHYMQSSNFLITTKQQCKLAQLIGCIVLAVGFVTLPLKADVPPEVQAIFDNSCNGAGCHNGTVAPDLSDATISETSLVNVTATCNNSISRVEEGDPLNSALYQKLTGTSCGNQMPLNAPPLSQADIQVIYEWIASLGANGLIEMADANLNAQEDAGNLSVTINRMFGSQGAVSVDYTVTTLPGDTATADVDYTAATDTVNFADGQTTRTFDVVILDDSDFEGSETFSITLSNPQGGAVLGAQDETQVTITDNEIDQRPGTFLFRRASDSINENGTSIDVEVIRTFGESGQVTVDVTSADNTAMAGNDYTMVSQTLSFDEGIRSQIFSVAILDDQQQENDETFSISLSNSGGGADIGSANQISITITDDDGATGGGGGNTGGGNTGGGNTGGGNTGGGNTGGGGQSSSGTDAEFEPAGGLLYLPVLMLLLFVIRARQSKFNRSV